MPNDATIEDRRHHAVHDDVADDQHAQDVLGRLGPGDRLVADRLLDAAGDIAGGVGVVELDDEAIDAIGAVEHHLRALQQHEGLRLVVVRVAGAEDADDLHRPAGAVRRRDTQRAADAEVELVGEALADHDAVRIGGERVDRSVR